MRKILSLSKHGVLSIGRNRSLGIISANSAWKAWPSTRPPYLALGTTTTTLGQESAFSTSARYFRGSSAITGSSQQDEHLSKQLFSSNAENGDSTIYALSTAPGRAAIAIIRISGPACLQIYRALCPRARDPKPRLATVRALYEPTSAPSPSTLLDPGALVLYFPSPRTVTGEDVLELHVHGGPATVKAVFAALENCNKVLAFDGKHDGVSPLAFASIRYAEAGEFTRRAFMNDVLDLPQIEALGETLNAETEQQRRLAVRGASSNTLSARYEDWRQQLLYARGELEALIDFSEDQHFDESPQELIGSVAAQVRELRQRIQYHILNASKGELLRNGIKIALLGAPNAGKSSLLNRVVGKEAAIVSTEEGTTRDIVDVGIDLGGWYCKIGDMAGLRSAANGDTRIGAVELEGIRRAKHRALESDVVVVVLSLSDGMDGTTIPQLTVDPEVLEAVHSCQAHNKKIVIVINKADRLPASLPERRDLAADLMTQTRTLFKGVSSDQIFLISCKEAEQGSSLGLNSTDPGNVQKFLRGLIMAFEEIASPEGIQQDYDKYDVSYWEDSLGVSHRQQSNLQQCLEHLERFLSETGNSIHPQQHDANNNNNNNNNDQQKPEQNVLNNTSAYANLEVKFYTETQSDAHAFSGSDASKIQIQAQTPSDAVYNPNPQEWGANEKQRKDNNSTYGNNRNNDNAATSSVEAQVDIVTAAENLRFAAESLAQITGRGGADVEDVLGVVFEKFCVGK